EDAFVSDQLAVAHDLTSRGFLETAARSLEAAHARYPNRDELRAEIARLEAELSRQHEMGLASALKDADAIVKTGDWKAALSALDAAAGAYGERSEIKALRERVHTVRAEQDAAASRVKIEAERARVAARVQEIEAALAQNQWAEAFALIERALQAHPDDTSLREYRRRAETRRREAEEAES